MSQSLYTTQVPTLPDVNEGSPVTVGITLIFSVAGTVSGARFYVPATVGAGTYTGTFWVVTSDDSGGVGTGTLLASAVFVTLVPGTWVSVLFASAVAVDTTHAYVVALRSTEGRYAATGGLYASAIVNGNITGIQDGTSARGFTVLSNGRFTGGVASYPENTFGHNGYFIDVLFDPSGPPVQDMAVALTATAGLTAALTREVLPTVAMTATAGLGAALTREVRPTVALTATGGMSAALTNEAHLTASMTATGGGSVALTADVHLAVAFTATAGLSATMSVPTVGPVDPIGTPVAEELLACFREQLATLPDPPARVDLRVGQETGPLIGPGVDECCPGLAWVRIASIYPSWDSFPAADNTWLPCGPLAYAVVLEMGIAFCMPWSNSEEGMDNLDPPSEQDWATAFNTQMLHQTLMRRTAACCFRPTQRRAVGEWTPLSVEGGCTGGKLTVTVSVMAPCGDC